MNRRASGLSLVVFSLLIMACEVSSLAPTIAPTYTPDRIGTRVAEEKAIAATLTVDASKLAQTPLPTETSKPTTQVQTPTSTSTPILPTRTPTASSLGNGRIEGKVTSIASGAKVTLCNKVNVPPVSLYPEPVTCIGEFQVATIDATGYFLFSSVPPSEDTIFNFLFDFPESLLPKIPQGAFCPPKSYSRRDRITNGVRESCFVLMGIKAGQTTQYVGAVIQ